MYGDRDDRKQQQQQQTGPLYVFFKKTFLKVKIDVWKRLKFLQTQNPNSQLINLHRLCTSG